MGLWLRLQKNAWHPGNTGLFNFPLPGAYGAGVWCGVCSVGGRGRPQNTHHTRNTLYMICLTVIPG
ncbi:hypothetical protein KDA_15710 [Dictyobacter alpinus]|uniref:Uncharacterized protein n=1 Tax=Dictyobacter alpinus TaxID=2014873 RepID=A0A402B450_9CHLR|nr:hypothetical protein KDA_15710 [Dictyobacter alpinus]